MNLWRVTVSPRSPDHDAHGHAVLGEIHEFGLPHVTAVRSSRLYWLSGPLDRSAVERIANELLADPVIETHSMDTGMAAGDTSTDPTIEIHLKGGIMDPAAQSTMLAIADMGLVVDQVRTGRRYRITGARTAEELAFTATHILANTCIEDVFLNGCGRNDPLPDTLPTPTPYRLKLRRIAICGLDDDGLMRLSREGHLFLSLDEMRAIQDHFRSLEREPTDIELETFAQTWSEHCVHKTLKSEVHYEGAPFPGNAPRENITIDATSRPDRVRIRYENLLKQTIVEATTRVDKPWCISVFEDNAGIIEFDETYGIAFKVETHNHPSAIEPYGGAATGVGGCVRDIIGCGLAAKPVANTDVFCFAPPEVPDDELPKGVLHPRRVMKGVVGGVRDYGNRMGIPTVNGAIHFDPRYLGNPLVFCGCVGLIPRELAFKKTSPGDRIVVVGGRTGRDGIHGATFSSSELTDTHADEFSHAVQIGNAITEKKMLDTILQARDHADGCLYGAITDCGAGGLSSAVGEMGEACGARVDLEKIPLKYTGLRYDEIWISEAQERMVLAVPPKNLDRLMAIFEAENVEATDIGEFTDDDRLTLLYDGTQVGQLSMPFLHHGVPKPIRSATWTPDAGASLESLARPVVGDTETALLDGLRQRLGDLNTASKEWVIRQYDHEVQGGSVIKPLSGPGQGPSDAAVLRPRLDSERAIALGCGLCPQLAQVDPYWMAVAAVDEAVRNVVCVGADLSRIAILDNFCWPSADDPQQMGALVRTCQGAYDAAVAYGLPFISGKDSLHNEFVLDPKDVPRIGNWLKPHLSANHRLAIPPTLLISAIGVLDDAARCITMDLKHAGNQLWYVGGKLGEDLDRQAAVHAHVSTVLAEGLAVSCHDVSEGGLLTAAAEMAIAGCLGLRIDVQSSEQASEQWSFFFGEHRLGYLLEVPTVAADRLAAQLAPHATDLIPIGRVAASPTLRMPDGDETSLEELDRYWRTPLWRTPLNG